MTDIEFLRTIAYLANAQRRTKEAADGSDAAWAKRVADKDAELRAAKERIAALQSEIDALQTDANAMRETIAEQDREIERYRAMHTGSGGRRASDVVVDEAAEGMVP